MLELSSGIVSGKEVSLGEDTHCTCGQSNTLGGARGGRVACRWRAAGSAFGWGLRLARRPRTWRWRSNWGSRWAMELVGRWAAAKWRLRRQGRAGRWGRCRRRSWLRVGTAGSALSGRNRRCRRWPICLREEGTWSRSRQGRHGRQGRGCCVTVSIRDRPRPGHQATALTAEEDVAGLRGLVRAGVQGLVPQRPRLGLDERLEDGAVRVAVLPQALPQADARLQPARVQVRLLDQVAQWREQVDEELQARTMRLQYLPKFQFGRR